MARTIWRLLSFRLTPAEFAELGRAHLAVGLALAWAVGYGRWWDRPDQVAPLLRSGLVSVFLALGLGVVLGGFLTALRPPRGGLVQVCAFVALTAPPAAVYALPLERWLDLEVARALNVASLAVVATWRVALV
ncbi:MAG: hypothetical protein H6828_16260, partial [Planctomycetes bacterium]|nr:hypothetical protein [Planctomycetota bacterium]